MRHVVLPLTSLLLLASGTAAQTPGRAPLPADSLARARRIAGFFVHQQADSLYAAMPPDMQQGLGGIDGVTERMVRLTSQIGTEESVVEERWVMRNGQRQYWRFGRYVMADEPMVLRLVILPDGSLGGMGFNPASQLPPVDPEP